EPGRPAAASTPADQAGVSTGGGDGGTAAHAGPSPVRANATMGIALATAAYAVFSTQDAMVKWLVDDYTVVQILFMRSLTITIINLYLARRTGLRAALLSPARGPLLLRAAVVLIAWIAYYSAARHLQLAEMLT